MLKKMTRNVLVVMFLTALLFLSCKNLNEGVETIFDLEGCLVKKETKSYTVKNVKVNLFIETSGSMAGFMDKRGTLFQKDLWAIVEGLENKFGSNFDLMEVCSKNEPVKSLDARTFRNSLNTGGFVSSKSTDIPEMLDSIFKKAAKGTVSVLVSDLIFSPEDGNPAQMMQISTDIKKRFSNGVNASIILGLHSEFFKKKSKVLNSPYYVWIIGEEKTAFSISKVIKSLLGRSPKEVDFGVCTPLPEYSILPAKSAVANASPVICEVDQNYYVYDEFVSDDVKKMTFWIGINLSDLPGYMRDKIYLSKNMFAESNSAKVKIVQVSDASVISNSEDVKLVRKSNFTHAIKIELDEILENPIVEINIKRLRPTWIIENNLEVEDNLREKTFGLAKMITGLEAAYSINPNVFKKSFQILVTQNKK